MIIKFYDKDRPSIVIDDLRGERLRLIVNDPNTKFIDIDGHGTIAIGDIRSMTPSKFEKNNPFLQIPAHVKNHQEPTDEERQHRIDKWQEARRKFNERRYKNDQSTDTNTN